MSLNSVESMPSFWNSLPTLSDTSENSSTSSSAQSVHWMIQNRGGMAKLLELMMIPSQFLAPDAKSCREMIRQANDYVEPIEFSKKGLQGIICFPENNKTNSRCILYHNPNGITVAQFFEQGRLKFTAGELLALKNCPIIMYDYRGTGISAGDKISSIFRFRPTYESIVEDGLAALAYALQNFDHVDVWGSSLGGGVATVSFTERYLAKNPAKSNCVTLTNHDSFTTTSRVIYPTNPKFADWLGSIFGGHLDAHTPMESLLKRNIKVTVIYHQEDPVIPGGARMAEFALQQRSDHLRVIASPGYGHANLSRDMIQSLQE